MTENIRQRGATLHRVSWKTNFPTSLNIMVNHQYAEQLDLSPLFFQNPVYNWSPEIQGIIFSSIFYGSVIFQIPAGYLSGIYSVKKMVGSTLFVSSLINLFIPLAAQVGETLVIVCRVAQGVAQVLR